MTEQTLINPTEYYENDEYLSNSALSNFCEFDIYGNPTYNLSQFLNPTRPSSSAIVIWQLCDKILTEGFILDSEYGPTLDKAGMQEQLDFMGVEYKKTDTNPILRNLLAKNGYVFKKELGKDERTAIETIIDRANNFQYDMKTSFREFISECDCQKICVSEEWGMKGKFDFLNRSRWLISDLKTTGNLERTMKELTYKWQPNIYHKYVRQLAIYQQLYYLESGERFDVELIFIDYKGKHRIVKIWQRALDKAMEQIDRDIEMLKKMYSGDLPFTPVLDIDEATVDAIDSGKIQVQEVVTEEVKDSGPDYLTTF